MPYREITASESTKNLDGKENVVPHSNMSDYFNKSSSEIVKSDALCTGSASESTKKEDGKENVMPHSNTSDCSNKTSSKIFKSDASCTGSARFTGNTWEEYFTATLEKSAESKKKDLHRSSASAADMELTNTAPSPYSTTIWRRRSGVSALQSLRLWTTR